MPPHDEAQLKGDTGYGGPLARPLRADAPKDTVGHPHLGVLIASCDRGDIRTTPEGLCVYEDLAVNVIPVAKDRDGEGRGAVLDELAAAIARRTAPLHDGRWGKATLEVCLAMLQSSRERREVRLAHQCVPNE